MTEHLHFVIASYGFAALVLAGICVDSYMRWRQVKGDYLRLFARKEKSDA